MSKLHREIDAPPYRIVINAEREYLPGKEDPNGGYYARGDITRPDGESVYESFLHYQISQSETFETLDDALGDVEKRAREAINAGFPH